MIKYRTILNNFSCFAEISSIEIIVYFVNLHTLHDNNNYFCKLFRSLLVMHLNSIVENLIEY